MMPDSDLFPHRGLFKDRHKIRIKFFAGMIPTEAWNNNLWINPSSWVIKCYYDLRGRFADRLEWLDPQLNDKNMGTEELLSIIDAEQPDVVCFGLYLWNHDRYNALGSAIKARYPQTIIMVGGPEVDVHRNPDSFWQSHDYADMVIYGDGEEAFTGAMDSMFDGDSTSPVPNLVFRADGVSIDCGYKRFADEQHSKISPYIHNQESIRQAVSDIRKTHDHGMLINWEFTRGCPYKCSFCDWSSGLHHKTYRKSYDYSSDLELFSELDLTVNWIDANIGLFKQDTDIVERGLELGRNNPKFRLRLGNYSKVKKEVVYDLMERVEKQYPGVESHLIAVQDIDPQVLKNIDRPDIPWEEHRKLLSDLRSRNPQMRFNVEVIIGLPGQTLESYADMLWQFARSEISMVAGSLFNLLPNSPAADQSYQDRFGMRFDDIGYMHSFPKEFRSLEEIAQGLKSCDWTKSKFITDTYSSNFGDHLAMMGMSYFYVQHATICERNNLRQDSDHLYKILKSNTWQKFGQTQAEAITNTTSIFGFPMILVQEAGKIRSFYQYFSDRSNWQQFLKA